MKQNDKDLCRTVITRRGAAALIELRRITTEMMPHLLERAVLALLQKTKDERGLR